MARTRAPAGVLRADACDPPVSRSNPGPALDASVANHLVQTVEAARLLGATVIVTGLSPEIAQTLVTIGVVQVCAAPRFSNRARYPREGKSTP